MPLWGDKQPEPPEWARPLSRDQYALFVSTIGDVVDALNARDQRSAIPTGLIRLRNSAGEVSSFGLQNLAQMLASAPTSDWPRLVSEHFQNMLTVDLPPQTAAEALPMLRVRVWHADYVREAREAIYRELAPELVLALVVDLPKKVMSVTRGNLGMWSMSEEMAWKAAEANSKQESYEIVPQTTPDGAELLFVIGDSFYVTSNVLWLDERLQLVAENGALVGIPTRHLLVVLPIRDIRALRQVSRMHASNGTIYQEGPGSISPELFWWRGGRLMLLPIDRSVEPAQFRPPDEFVEMLNRLAAGGAGSD